MNIYFENNFDLHKRFEKDHFWSKIKRDVIVRLMQRYVSKDKKILELGASSGELSERLIKEGYSNLTISDINLNAIKSLSETFPMLSREHILCIDAQDWTPQKQYDCIVHFDLLEHLNDDLLAMKNIVSGLKKDGVMFFSVPAYPWLYSKFDRDVGHYRRYSKTMILEILKRSGLKKLYLSYFYSSTFFLVIFKRVITLLKLAGNTSELEVPNHTINGLFFNILKFEIIFLFSQKIPFGSSLFVVAQKK